MIHIEIIHQCIKTLNHMFQYLVEQILNISSSLFVRNIKCGFSLLDIYNIILFLSIHNYLYESNVLKINQNHYNYNKILQ